MTNPLGYYQNNTVSMPIFDFMIPKEDFYISTPGISVTEKDKSYSSASDGAFSVLNKNTVPVYFNSLNLTSVKIRNDSMTPNGNMKIVYSGATIDIDEVYLTEKYKIQFKSNTIGVVSITRLLKHKNELNVKLEPFQSIKFTASYEVYNLSNLAMQYYGKSTTNPNKKIGTLDFDITIKIYGDKELTILTTNHMAMTVNLVNNGYVGTTQS